MATAEPSDDFEDFIAAHPQLLRRDLLEAHYSRERLMSSAPPRMWAR